MATSGNWIVQNKVRPGAYVNTVVNSTARGSMADVGVMTCALPLTWGPADTLIEVLASDLYDGKSDYKVGTNALQIDESLPLRLALSGCQKALIYRADTGGTKADAILIQESAMSLVVVAKYAGSMGNNLAVSIIKGEATGAATIEIYLNGIKKQTIAATSVKGLTTVKSNWVEFTVTGDLTEFTDVSKLQLVGGTNGTVTDESYNSFFSKLPSAQWNTVAVPSESEPVQQTVVSTVLTARAATGKQVVGVVSGSNSADNEGIIAVKQGFSTELETVSPQLFAIWVASHYAGAGPAKSLTSYQIEGAKSIINPIDDAEIEDNLKEGWFLLSYRQDGAVCVEQDINSLHNLTAEKPYIITKNRVVRCLDTIRDIVATKFNSSYSGKISNDEIGRNMLKSDYIGEMDKLQGISAIRDFKGAEDIIVLPGEAIDSVVVDLEIQPVDSMEKLYMTVIVNG